MARTDLWNFPDEAVARIDLTGFELYAHDGALGKVVESIEASGGGYLVVDAGFAMPLGRQLLVPAGLVDKVDVDERRVSIRAEREQIRSAPEYEERQIFDERFRSRMDKYYGPLMGEGASRTASQRRRPSSGRGSSKSTSRSASSRARSSARTGARQTAANATRAELYEQAKRLGIEGRSKMNKAALARAVGRRRGSTGGGRSRAKANPVEVQAFLEGVGYPTGKRKLLREAESQGAGREVRATLRRLPDKDFGSPTEVSEAISRLG
jgi:Protein of unknown function (DUF2795)